MAATSVGHGRGALRLEDSCAAKSGPAKASGRGEPARSAHRAKIKACSAGQELWADLMICCTNSSDVGCGQLDCRRLPRRAGRRVARYVWVGDICSRKIPAVPVSDLKTQKRTATVWRATYCRVLLGRGHLCSAARTWLAGRGQVASSGSVDSALLPGTPHDSSTFNSVMFPRGQDE